MKKLLASLPQNKHETGHTEIIYECSNGCVFSQEMLKVIRLRNTKITKGNRVLHSNTKLTRCPYCNSEHLSKLS